MKRYRCSVRRDGIVSRFPFVVVDAQGATALWRPDAKVGTVPMRFRTEGIARVVAERLSRAA